MSLEFRSILFLPPFSRMVLIFVRVPEIKFFHLCFPTYSLSFYFILLRINYCISCNSFTLTSLLSICFHNINIFPV